MKIKASFSHTLDSDRVIR